MKNTDDLLKDLKSEENIDNYISSNETYFADTSFADYIKKLIKSKNLREVDVKKLSQIQYNYACQIFSGAKNPSRDKVLCIVLAMGLDFDETQQLLKSCGLPTLYAKHKRDSIIIFAVNRKMSVPEADELLYEQGEKTLTSPD